MSNLPSSYTADSGATVTFTPSDSDAADWTVDVTRTVQTNGYYRFIVSAASTLTSDQVLGRQLPGLEHEEYRRSSGCCCIARPMGLTTWWIHAIWTGSPSTIPDSISPLFYGPLEQYIGAAPVGSGIVTLPTMTIAASTGSNIIPVIGLLTGAAMVAFAVWISRRP